MMKRKKLILLSLTLFITVTFTQASGATMGTAFTYQGRLIDANDTAQGVYDIMFHLYDSPEGPNEIDITDLQDVEIINGYFTVELVFDVELFSGDWRWLEISIRPGDSNDPDGYVTLSPRQQITPTPYALYARRSGFEVPFSLTGSTDVEWIMGATNDGNGPALGGISLTGYGVRGQSTSGYGILGTNTGGKYGYLGGDEYGAYGTNNNGNFGGIGGNVYGVYGESTSGYGVLGMNTDGSYGLLGGSNNGVYGSSDTGHGVYGTTNTGYAVYGYSNNTTGYAGYFSGNGYFSGKVGIGTTAPKNKLDVEGAVAIGTHYSETETAPANGMIIEGNVGIGTTTPDKELTVEGTIEANDLYTGVYGHAIGTYGHVGYGGSFETEYGIGVHGYANGDSGTGVYGGSCGDEACGVVGAACGSNSKGVEGSGDSFDFYAAGPGTNYGSPSSIRWKRNIQSIDNPLEKILQLRGVYFDWDAEHGGEHDVGMIAEEVGEVLPEIVQYEEDGIYTSGIDYSKMTPLLVEAVKALKTELDELQDQNAEKDAHIASQQKQIEELQKEVVKLKHLMKKVDE